MPRTLAHAIAPCLSASCLFLLLASPGRSAELVRLHPLDETASLYRSRGPGQECYELVARAQWSGKPTGIYAVRVVLPGGQAETRVLPSHERPGGDRITAIVPAAAVRNIRPSDVTVKVVVVDTATGAEVSNTLTADIDDFPHPEPDETGEDPGPFGWGEPLAGKPGEAALLPRPGPDDYEFVRIPSAPGMPAFFLATAEATIGQVERRLKGYDPKAGRSDDFELEGPSQPAVGLTPDQAQSYLRALSAADPAHAPFRLPTRDEWLRAARAGRSTPFWWGDKPSHPTGANFHGPEPALKEETTALAIPRNEHSLFEANPWMLFHTFGNVSEWAVAPGGGFVQLGGNFRTEPEVPLPEVVVRKGDSTGSVPYVGVRPALSFDARSGADVVLKRLRTNPKLGTVAVAFDPDRATATLTGKLPESALRGEADRLLEPLWFLAAVDNRIETPTLAPGQLARLGEVVGPIRRITPLGRWVYEIPVEVLWDDLLPVEGSEWWVNVYLPGGASFAHRLVEPSPGESNRVIVLIDRTKMETAGLRVDTPVSVALSLGAEAPNPADPRVVSNVAPVRWKLP